MKGGEIDMLSNALDKIESLVFEHNYGYKEAIDEVKYELGGDKIYDPETGKNVCDIDESTIEQIRNLLR